MSHVIIERDFSRGYDLLKLFEKFYRIPENAAFLKLDINHNDEEININITKANNGDHNAMITYDRYGQLHISLNPSFKINNIDYEKPYPDPDYPYPRIENMQI